MRRAECRRGALALEGKSPLPSWSILGWLLLVPGACRPTTSPTDAQHLGPTPTPRVRTKASAAPAVRRAGPTETKTLSTEPRASGDSAGALPPVAPPEFPTHTTAQEPYLGRQLDLASSVPSYFSSTPALRREHELPLRVVQAVTHALRSGRWRIEIRTGCPVEHNGNVFVEGRAVVRDSSGKIRAYAQDSGTGDSASVWKLYYDSALRLRVAVFSWANYMGQSSDGIVQFDENGHVQSCTSHPGAEPPWPCGHQELPELAVDADVAAALSPDVRARRSDDGRSLGPVAWVLSVDALAEFSKCRVPYQPHQ
jgi:hypothetical protein